MIVGLDYKSGGWYRIVVFVILMQGGTFSLAIERANVVELALRRTGETVKKRRGGPW